MLQSANVMIAGVMAGLALFASQLGQTALRSLVLATGVRALQANTISTNHQVLLKTEAGEWQAQGFVNADVTGTNDFRPLQNEERAAQANWEGTVARRGVTLPIRGEARMVSDDIYVLPQALPPDGARTFNQVVGKWWRVSPPSWANPDELEVDLLIRAVEWLVQNAHFSQPQFDFWFDRVDVPFSISGQALSAVVPICRSDRPLQGTLFLSWQQFKLRNYNFAWSCQLQQPIPGVAAGQQLLIEIEGVVQAKAAPLKVSAPTQNTGEEIQLWPDSQLLKPGRPAELPFRY